MHHHQPNILTGVGIVAASAAAAQASRALLPDKATAISIIDKKIRSTAAFIEQCGEPSLRDELPEFFFEDGTPLPALGPAIEHTLNKAFKKSDFVQMAKAGKKLLCNGRMSRYVAHYDFIDILPVHPDEQDQEYFRAIAAFAPAGLL